MNSSDTGAFPPQAVTAILVAAGRGERAGSGPRKQFRLLGGRPLVARTLEPFTACRQIGNIILVVPDPEEAARILSGHLPGDREVRFVPGGATRQASTAAGVSAAAGADLVLVHDGARPFVTEDLIRRVLAAAAVKGAAVPVSPVGETLKRVGKGGEILETVGRERFVLAQTPQGFRRQVLAEALARARAEGYEGTDEAELVERLGRPVARVAGSLDNLKVTTAADFARAEAMMGLGSGTLDGLRIGVGYDVHPLVPGRPLILGGVEIPHPMGPSGHSDGDLICHAVIDAVLGAAGLPDIGQLFPDTDPRYRNARSLHLLSEAAGRIRDTGFVVGNLDLVLMAEEPKVAPYRDMIRKNLAEALGIDPARVGVKGKRGEGLGFTGRKEGMAVHAVALLIRWRQGPER